MADKDEPMDDANAPKKEVKEETKEEKSADNPNKVKAKTEFKATVKR